MLSICSFNAKVARQFLPPGCAQWEPYLYSCQGMLGQFHILGFQSQLERKQAFLPGKHINKDNIWAQQSWQSSDTSLMHTHSQMVWHTYIKTITGNKNAHGLKKNTAKKICAEMIAYQHLPWPQEEPTQGPSTNCFDAQIITCGGTLTSPCTHVPCSFLNIIAVPSIWGELLEKAPFI